MQKNRLILLTLACFVLSLALGVCAGFALNPCRVRQQKILPQRQSSQRRRSLLTRTPSSRKPSPA